MRFLLLVFVLTSNFSFADDGIEDMKTLCKDPGAYHNQLPPSEIKITCFDERFEWTATDAQDSEFKNKRKVCSKAVANKPGISVPYVCTDCSHFPTPNSCMGYKEQCKTVEMTYAVTCDEVMAAESFFKFCFDKLNSEVAATEEKILEVKDTGKTMTTCGIKVYVNGKETNEKPTVVNVIRK